MSMNSYLSSFKSIRGIGMGVGVLIPAFSFFVGLAPPLLPKTGLIASAFAAASIVIVYYFKPKPSGRSSRLPKLVKLAVTVLLLSVAILVIYLFLLEWCTVVQPEDEGSRLQIGFGRAQWSLTEKGRQLKMEHSGQTIVEWMLRTGAFGDKGPEIIWEPWAIYLSGCVMIVAFIAMFVLWTVGWALLAKQKATKSISSSSKKLKDA